MTGTRSARAIRFAVDAPRSPGFWPPTLTGKRGKSSTPSLLLVNRKPSLFPLPPFREIAVPRHTEDFSIPATKRVRDMVKHHRRAGLKIRDAFRASATDLGVSYRRVCTLWYGDRVWRMASAEFNRLMERWGDHLDRELAALDRRAEELQAEQIAHRALMADGQQTVHECGKSTDQSAPNGRRSNQS